jgi:tetratricopeptide (TPR) repeat protein
VEVGSQTIRWSQNTITQADVELSVYGPEGNRFNTQQLKSIALHEIGHAMGLRGHSTNPRDIMYPSMTPQATGLSARDVNTARALYRLRPDISNPIGAHLMAYRYYMYYLSMGIQANNNRNNTQAMEYFKKATQYYPNDPKINYYLGMGSYNNKQYTQAISQLSKALPNLVDDRNMQASAQFFLAQASMAQGINDMKAKRSAEGRKRLQDANNYFAMALQAKELPSSLRQVAITNQQRLKQMAT